MLITGATIGAAIPRSRARVVDLDAEMNAIDIGILAEGDGRDTAISVSPFYRGN